MKLFNIYIIIFLIFSCSNNIYYTNYAYIELIEKNENYIVLQDFNKYKIYTKKNYHILENIEYNKKYYITYLPYEKYYEKYEYYEKTKSPISIIEIYEDK